MTTVGWARGGTVYCVVLCTTAHAEAETGLLATARCLEAVGVPCSPVNDIPELAETEQLKAADLLRNLPGTDLRVVGLPIVFDGQRPHPRSDAPRLGEYNDELFSSGTSHAAE